jgi:hypothetical protein
VNDSRRTVWDVLAALDRRWLYLTLALSLVAAMLSGLRFKDRPSRLVQPLYDKVESLPPGSAILISCDYTPSSAPELEPMAYALTRHALLEGHRLCFVSMWPDGSNQIERVVSQVIAEEFPDRREGSDWVNLGFKSGSEMLINAMRQDISAMYTTDVNNKPLRDLPALAGIGTLADFALIISLSSGTPGLKEWILYAGDPLRIPLGGGCNGAGTTQFLPYFPRQLLGLLGGIKGAAEYETALAEGHPEFPQRTMAASDSMGPQAVAHIAIIVFILLGNLGGLLARRGRGGDGS